MKTYELLDSDGRLHAFEINNAGIGRHGVCGIVRAIPGARLVREPKFLSWFREEVFCEFEVDGQLYVAWEPYGDNSRYWIGPEPARWQPQTERIRNAFDSVRGLRLFRWGGFILGTFFMLFGVWLLGAEAKNSTFLVAISALGTGVYFINYSLTGRSTIWRRRRSK